MKGEIDTDKAFSVFKRHDYFIYDNVEYHDDIRNELMEKKEKMQLRKLYIDSLTVPTEEECEDAKVEYLRMVGKCRANTLVTCMIEGGA